MHFVVFLSYCFQMHLEVCTTPGTIWKQYFTQILGQIASDHARQLGEKGKKKDLELVDVKKCSNIIAEIFRMIWEHCGVKMSLRFKWNKQLFDLF